MVVVCIPAQRNAVLIDVLLPLLLFWCVLGHTDSDLGLPEHKDFTRGCTKKTPIAHMHQHVHPWRPNQTKTQGKGLREGLIQHLNNLKRPSRVKLGGIVHSWGACKLVQPLGKTVWRFLKKTRNKTTTWHSNSMPGHVYLKNNTHTNLKRFMLLSIHDYLQEPSNRNNLSIHQQMTG